MTLKRNIKIILVGLFLLIFVGLMYSLFRSTPEIISDESLRVEEPPLPGIESQIELAASANGLQSTAPTESKIESSMANESIDRSVVTAQDPQVAENVDKPWLQLSSPEVELQEPSGSAALPENAISSTESAFTDGIDQPKKVAVDENIDSANDEFLVFESPNGSKGGVELSLNNQSSAEQNPEDAKFLDLNSSEVISPNSEALLGKEDQLIVDDLNKALAKFNIDISANSDKKKEISTKQPLLENNKADLSKKTHPGDDISSNGMTAKSSASAKKPSVFTPAEADQELIQGNSDISKEYRQTMAKLISINAKLRDANEENAELQARFDMSVSQNRQLAQIIRDIDTQIKSFTVN